MLDRIPNDPDAWFLLGVATAAAGRYGHALPALGRAVAEAPANAEYRAQLARCLAMLGREADALAAAEAALELGPEEPLALDTLGVVFSRAGSHERAAALFRRAAARAPDNPGYHYNLGSALRFCGDFAAAEAAFETVVRLAPREYRAHSALAEIRKQTPARNHLARLEALLAGVGVDVDGELHLRQALAKEYEDLGEFEAAFRHLAAGRARKRRAVGYTFAEDRALFECVERVCDAAFCNAATPGAAEDAPIFVVGLPRTGTTLVERLLASHSSVVSGGELQHFGRCLKRAAGTPTPRVLDAATLTAAAGADLAGVGRSYLEGAAALKSAAPRFVDKLPLNFFYAAFIHRALPAARIVCLRRTPLDACLAIFRQLFAVGFPHYRYALDLDNVAEYFVCFDRLLHHWREAMPGVVLEVGYEGLVTEPAAETRRLLEFCGLPYEEGCLAFHTNRAPVASASAVQVREPLHARSIGRWRHYAEALGRVRERLLAAGIDPEAAP